MLDADGNGSVSPAELKTALTRKIIDNDRGEHKPKKRGDRRYNQGMRQEQRWTDRL